MAKHEEIKLCIVCEKPLYIYANFNNDKEHCRRFLGKDLPSFRYMEIDEGAHIDCYIEHIVNKILDEREKDSEHPWGKFLDARLKTISWLRKAGYDDAYIAQQLSMDAEHVLKVRTACEIP